MQDNFNYLEEYLTPDMGGISFINWQFILHRLCYWSKWSCY